YPELEAVGDEINRSYDDLYRNESVEFALAYPTTIELSFKRIARYLVEHRQRFFAGGDPRMTAFILSHFVEEFEHKHAMFDVYQDDVGDYWYRVKVARRTVAHVRDLGNRVWRACTECEPLPQNPRDLPPIPL